MTELPLRHAGFAALCLTLTVWAGPVRAQDAAGPLPEPEWTPLRAEEVAHKRELVRAGAEVLVLLGRNPNGTYTAGAPDGSRRELSRDQVRVARRVVVFDAETPAELGDHVEVRWNGSFHVARIVDVGPQLKVHYLGWSHSWDERVERKRVRIELRLAAVTPGYPLAPGEAVQVLRDDGWHPAVVVQARGERYAVRCADGAELDADRPRLRCEVRFRAGRPKPFVPKKKDASPPGTPATETTELGRGSHVLVKEGDGWLVGLVLSRNDEETIRVRLAGWGAAWDRNVPLGSLRHGFRLDAVEVRPPPRG